MDRLRTALAAALVLALAPLPAPAQEPEGGPGAAPAQPAPLLRLDEPDYDEALDAFRAMRWGTATRLLERYLERPGGTHRAEAEVLRDLARDLAVTAETGLPPGVLDQRGRAELAVFSTTYGVWAGGALLFLLQPEHVTVEQVLFTVAAVGGVGLGTSLVATSGRAISEGRARMISMGGFWGTLNASAIGAEAGLEGRNLVAAMLGVGLAGIATGATVLDEAPPPGYLALVNTAGLWSGYATGLVLVIADSNLEATDNWALILAGADVGLVTAAAVAGDAKISQGRVRLIDLGGVLGTLVGGAVAWGGENPAEVGTPLLVGTAAGLTLATLATNDWDEPAGGEVRSELQLRGPGPAILPGTDGKSLAFGVNLASGNF